MIKKAKNFPGARFFVLNWKILFANLKGKKMKSITTTLKTILAAPVLACCLPVSSALAGDDYDRMTAAFEANLAAMRKIRSNIQNNNNIVWAEKKREMDSAQWEIDRAVERQADFNAARDAAKAEADIAKTEADDARAEADIARAEADAARAEADAFEAQVDKIPAIMADLENKLSAIENARSTGVPRTLDSIHNNFELITKSLCETYKKTEILPQLRRVDCKRHYNP